MSKTSELKKLLDWYRDGNRYIAVQHDPTYEEWEPCKSQREAVEWARDGRSELEAIQWGARVESIADQIAFEMSELELADLGDITLRDLMQIARLVVKASGGTVRAETLTLDELFGTCRKVCGLT